MKQDSTVEHKYTNQLINEKSPYLLQHAHNPVNWYPWSEEAFMKAEEEDKPIFLSIGYSTCHWCHVMAHESFEDEEVAEMLNRDFVSVKVDREERPDIDHLYMGYCQALTGQGGWPLTIIMTPDKKPFFAGTYFPKKQKFGRYGLTELLPQIARRWKNDRDVVLQTGDKIVEETKQRLITQIKGPVSEETLQQAVEEYTRSYDAEYGGFGSAPKFPSPHNLAFLLRHYKQSGNPAELEMVERTLEAMHRGGIYDHIGFGFARYSTDRKWLVPHFEKMLYDNALLAIAYTEAYQLTGKQAYREIAEQIFAYVLRDMRDGEGGFYSAEDADSEGVEGKFYVWRPEEVESVLGEEDAAWFCELFDISEQGNFEGESIPNLLTHATGQFAALKSLPHEELKEKIDQARSKLFAHREKRIHPHKDDKILTAWNGLMIAALSMAGRAFQKKEYLDSAEQAVKFILTKLRREDGRLLARYRDGEAAFPGYLDDYAFLAWGLIELYEAGFSIEYLRQAVDLNARMQELFWDEDKGGFYFSGSDSEQLLSRVKEIYDGAMPSGNSVAAYNLIRLSKLTGDATLAAAAEDQFAAFGGSVERYPAGHAMMLTAVLFAYGEGKEIVIAGGEDESGTKDMLARLQQKYLPESVVILRPREGFDEPYSELMKDVEDKVPLDGKATVYVCENFACQAPTTDPAALDRL